MLSLPKHKTKDTADSRKSFKIIKHKTTLFMTNTEQIKGIVERLGALRRYL
jgi:hypothetical protein